MRQEQQFGVDLNQAGIIEAMAIAARPSSPLG
jgi:hypothetical protein